MNPTQWQWLQTVTGPFRPAQGRRRADSFDLPRHPIPEQPSRRRRADSFAQPRPVEPAFTASDHIDHLDAILARHRRDLAAASARWTTRSTHIVPHEFWSEFHGELGRVHPDHLSRVAVRLPRHLAWTNSEAAILAGLNSLRLHLERLSPRQRAAIAAQAAIWSLGTGGPIRREWLGIMKWFRLRLTRARHPHASQVELDVATCIGTLDDIFFRIVTSGVQGMNSDPWASQRPPMFGSNIPVRLETALGSQYEVTASWITRRKFNGEIYDSGNRNIFYVDKNTSDAILDIPFEKRNKDGVILISSRRNLYMEFQIGKRNVRFRMTNVPAIGLFPVDLYLEGDGNFGWDNGLTRRSDIHVGHEIVRIS